MNYPIQNQRFAGGAVPQKSDKAVIDTKKELAAVAGVSHDTIAKVENIEAGQKLFHYGQQHTHYDERRIKWTIMKKCMSATASMPGLEI